MFSNKRSNWFFPFSITFLLLVSFTIFGFNETFKDLYPINKYSKVLEDPVADFSFSPNNVCANEPIKFTNLSTGTGLTYEWNFKDGNTSTQKDPFHVFSSATGTGVKNFSVTLTVKDEAGVSKSVSKTVAVKEIPSLKATSDQVETKKANV